MTQATTLQTLAERSSRFVAVPASNVKETETKAKGTEKTNTAGVTLDELRNQNKPVTDSLYVRNLSIVNGTFIVFKAHKDKQGLTLSLPSVRPRQVDDANDAALRAIAALDTPFPTGKLVKEVKMNLGKASTSVCLYDVNYPDLDSQRNIVNSYKMNGKVFDNASGYILFPLKRLKEMYAKKSIEKPFYIYEDKDDGMLSGEATFVGHDRSILIRLRQEKVL